MAARAKRAKDAALESSRSKFEFIANVSQEIRVPVNSMLGAIDLLLGTELSPQQRERVAGIHAAGDSLITIINDVLDFSKIEAGKLNLESIEFDLWQTVDLVYQIYRDQAARKGVNLVYVMPYSAPTALRGDPTRLRQLLINLVDNAVKFTDKGEVVLRIEVMEDAGPDVDGGHRRTVRRSERRIRPATHASPARLAALALRRAVRRRPRNSRTGQPTVRA